MRRTTIGTALLLVVAASVALAAKKPRDLIWTRSDIAQFRLDRIALIPVVSYDNNLQTENQVESVFGQLFKTSQYRWISGTTTRELLRAETGGDSVLKVIRGGILPNVRVDSLLTPNVAGMLHCGALLSVRVDQWEQHQPEWNQAGKPSTSVQLRAALVDSLGRLLWTASGSETAEGPYYDPSTNPVSVNDSGLERKPVTSQGGPPAFREVLTTLLTRWADQFPKKPLAAAPADSTNPAK